MPVVTLVVALQATIAPVMRRKRKRKIKVQKHFRVYISPCNDSVHPFCTFFRTNTMMYHRLVKFFILGICINISFGWDLVFNLNDDQRLLCHSCKGADCEKVTDNDDSQTICNRNTQLCWVSHI
jgi:hypothetical protein